jgi:hypothetical protein
MGRKKIFYMKKIGGKCGKISTISKYLFAFAVYFSPFCIIAKKYQKTKALAILKNLT